MLNDEEHQALRAELAHREDQLDLLLSTLVYIALQAKSREGARDAARSALRKILDMREPE